MKKNDYLYAVASVRSLENALLSKADLEQLINAESYQKAVLILEEKGYASPSGSDYSAVLDKELEKTWSYIREAAPEAECLNAFIVKNDFQNLKAILKAEVMGYPAESYLVKPCVFDAEKMLQLVSERRFDELPAFISSAAKQAYDMLTSTGNGQLCDAVADTAALQAILGFAEQSGDALLSEYAQQYVLSADIKTALRAIKTGRNEAFIRASVAENSRIDKNSFVSAAAGGEDAFIEYLASQGLSDYGDAFLQGGSVFEKYCDDKMLEIMKKAKMTAFGISPIAAYYAAKETEIKCLRIILSAKLSAASADIIRERMRELYV